MNYKSIDSPTVFISYSWDSEDHCKWVNRLAHILMSNSIEVLIDQLLVFPGSNLENFMKNGLSESRWVICILSDKYIDKMNDIKTGVGKEVTLIRENAKTEYVIPIIKDNPQNRLPELFLGKYYIDFDKNEFEKNALLLVNRLYGFEKMKFPFKGQNPFSREIAHERILESDILKTTYYNPAMSGEVSFDYSNNSGDYTIGSGEYIFVTHWSKASNQYIHAYNDKLGNGRIAIVKTLKDIKDFQTSAGLDFTSRARSVARGDGVVWINSYGNMAVTTIKDIKDDTRGDATDLLTFEYSILRKPV